MVCARCGGATQERLVRVHKSMALGLYAVGFVLAWWWGGDLLHDLAEGAERDVLPLWKVIAPASVIITATVALFVRWTQPVCAACKIAEPSWLIEPLDEQKSAVVLANPLRRKVLRALGGVGTGAVATAGGVGVAVVRNRGWIPVAHDFFTTKVENIAPEQRPEWKEAKVRNYRRLGRTNAMVSDISLGSGRINNADVARYAIERGITYFDTAPDYSDTQSERVLGEAMKGNRDKIFLATKFCVSSGHLPNDTPVPRIIEAVEASLKRLQTDHVDLIHVHSCDRVERLMAPNIHEAFDQLKQQGKVRFLGVSTHTPNLEEVANAAIDSGRFDVMMLAYHFGMWPSFGHILEKAKQHDVGIVAMKTLKGAKHTNLADFRQEAGSYAQSAFRWVLSNPAVACLVISIYEQRQVDEYLYASGAPVRSTDVALLERYDQLVSGDYCQPHCGLCLDSCEYELPINDVLRYRMYFKDYHWESEGKRQYAKLDRNASVCAECAAPCAGKCPIGVPIQEKMVDAHRWLA
ncbi:MAG TPA: aldo/keto reductase [Candidatus Acidoferrales bacterium]|nr:aldo/keto reductase [Candidatus Acidoferrales bacterium]